MAHILASIAPTALASITCLAYIACTPFLSAKDLGVYGPTVPIAEVNLLEYLESRIQKLSVEEKNDLFTKIQRQAAEKAANPKSLKLPRRLKSRHHIFDPTIVVNKDILDHQGNLLVQKGTRLNPLDTASLSAPLCFFDAEDSKQVQWAKKQEGKWILTGGKPLDLEKEEQKPVYFDQGGELCSKFGIRAVPALVQQQGSVLLVQEIALEECYE